MRDSNSLWPLGPTGLQPAAPLPLRRSSKTWSLVEESDPGARITNAMYCHYTNKAQNFTLRARETMLLDALATMMAAAAASALRLAC